MIKKKILQNRDQNASASDKKKDQSSILSLKDRLDNI